MKSGWRRMMMRSGHVSMAAVGAAVLPIALIILMCGCGRPSGQTAEDRSDGARENVASAAGAKGAGQAAAAQSNEVVALTLSAMDEEKHEGFGDDGQLHGAGTLSLPAAAAAPAVAPVMDDGPADGSASERAILLLPGGGTYEGEVKDGRPNGEGTLTDANGTRQWGMWHDGNAYTLKGTWVAPDGTTEVGTWNLDGTASGGTITWRDGRQYKGEWKLVMGASEVPEGTGEMNWPDGRKYVGQFHNGTMEGPGKMTYPNGKIEDGDWRQGKFAGTAQ